MKLVILVFALFASIFPVAKTALQYTQPLFLVGSRMIIAGLIMLAYLCWKHKEEVWEARKDLGSFLLLGLFAIYVTNFLEFWGLQYLTAAKTCFIYSLSPFMAAIISYLSLGEVLSKRKWLGLGIGFLGMIPILMLEAGGDAAIDGLGFLSWAEIAVLGATLASVYGWVLMRKLVQKGYSPLLCNGIGMLAGGIMATAHSYVSEDWSPVPVTDYKPFLWAILYMIVVSSFLCYNLYGYCLKRYTATFMAFAGFTTPFFAAFLGWIFLGETVSIGFWASSVVVLCGLFVFYREELSEEGIQVQEEAVQAGS